MLSGVCCLLLVVRCKLCVAMLFIDYCVLSVLCYMLFVVCWWCSLCFRCASVVGCWSLCVALAVWHLFACSTLLFCFWCVLFVGCRCSLLVDGRMLYGVGYLLSVIRCLLFVV